MAGGEEKASIGQQIITQDQIGKRLRRNQAGMGNWRGWGCSRNGEVVGSGLRRKRGKRGVSTEEEGWGHWERTWL